MEVTSDDERLLCLADTVLHPIQLGCPHFCGIVDVSPEQVLDTRRRLLDRAARRRCMVHAFHFPFPGLGAIEPVGSRWKWSARAR